MTEPQHHVDLDAVRPEVPPRTVVPKAPFGFAPAPAQEFYLGSRLRFGPVDTTLAGTSEASILLYVMVRAFTFWIAFNAIAFALALLTWPLFRFGGLTLFMPLATLASFVAFAIPVRIPISEWHWIVDGRARCAPTAYAAVGDVLARRATPVHAEMRRIVTDVSAKSGRNYLRLREGRFTAYVSAFAYGEDLYVGWTMWWESYPPVIVWDVMRSTVAAAMFRGSFFHRTVAADRAKAFRDVVHAATREGVDAAHEDRPPAATTFGQNVYVDKVPSWV